MNHKAAKVLAGAREKKGLRQHEVAEMLAQRLGQGYTTRQYQKLESGDFPKHKKIIVKELESILEANLYSLVYEQEYEQKSSPSVRVGIPTRAKSDLGSLRESIRQINDKIDQIVINSAETNSIAKSHYTSHLGYSEAIGQALDRVLKEPEGTLSELADTIDQKIWKRLQQKGIDAIVRI